MHLLYVAGRFPKTSETFVLNEVRAQLEAGHDVRVVSLRPGDEDATCILPSGTVIDVPTLPLGFPFVPRLSELAVPEERWTRKAYATAAARWIVERRLIDFAPDVVHAHFANLPTLIAGHLSVLLDVPYTFMPHATDYRRNMSDDLLRQRVRHADGVFVVSEAARCEIAARTGLSDREADRLRVVRAAVRPLDAPTGTDRHGDPTIRFVSVARHVPMKGIDIALRAFARLPATHTTARYDLVGEGPDTAALQALAADLGILDSVSFHGRLPNDQAQRMIAGSDIAVLPCRHDARGAADGLPVFLMEAGALGLPVITTGISGIPELIEDGTTGVLVPTEDVAAVADAMQQLADDVELRGRLGTNLRARVADEFSSERQVDRLHAGWAQLRDRRRDIDPDPYAPTHDRLPLSVVVVGRDEGSVIARCVAYASWADEILVAIDTRTTDHTADRARAAGARVRSIEWHGFAETKNDAAKLATHDWILSLDADEVVSNQLRASIEHVLRSAPDPRDGYAVERRSDFLGVLLPNDTRARTRRSYVRLFHRSHGAWDETMQVHERVLVPGRMLLLKGSLIQWRDFTLGELLERFNGYATIEAAELDRAEQRARAMDVLGRPILRFSWHYIVRREFKLGGRGVLHSALKASSEFMRWAKLWERQRDRDSNVHGLERAVDQT